MMTGAVNAFTPARVSENHTESARVLVQHTNVYMHRIQTYLLASHYHPSFGQVIGRGKLIAAEDSDRFCVIVVEGLLARIIWCAVFSDTPTSTRIVHLPPLS